MHEDDQQAGRAPALDAEQWLRRFAWTAVLGPLVFVVALPYLAMVVMEPRWPHRGMAMAAALGAVVVVCFGLVMATLATRAYREITALQQRALSAERHTAVLVERDRIAREMHDSLAQVLAVAHLRLRALDVDPGLAAAPRARAEVADVATLCQESCRDVRETILGLRGDVVQHQVPLHEALAGLLAAFERSSGIATSLDWDPAGLGLSGEERVQASRVVQEALANARKHSGARRVEVTGTRTPTGSRITVTDDGRGFDTTATGPEGHYGLHTMRERITQVGGRLEVVSAPGRGTRVVIDLPVTTPAKERR